MPEPNLTERQQKWFASVKASLERDTGKSLDAWVEIARACPETAHRARLKWFKDHHGLGQNRASQVLSAAFPSPEGWDEPEHLIAALWADAGARAIFEAVDAAARTPGEVLQTARKGFTAWSRKVQFAAARPVKGGTVVLGLAVAPDASARLAPAKNEGWSERLRSRTELSSPAEVDAEIAALLRAAWDRS